MEKVSELLKGISLPQLNKNCGIFCNSANRKKKCCNRSMQCERSMDRESFRIEILQSDSMEDHEECYNSVQDNLIQVFSYFKKRGGKFKISASEPVD